MKRQAYFLGHALEKYEHFLQEEVVVLDSHHDREVSCRLSEGVVEGVRFIFHVYYLLLGLSGSNGAAELFFERDVHRAAGRVHSRKRLFSFFPLLFLLKGFLRVLKCVSGELS